MPRRLACAFALLAAACSRSEPTGSAPAPSAAPVAFDRFHRLDDFVASLNGSGHKAEYVGAKLFAMVGAIDGGSVVIDGEEAECYLFDSRMKFDHLEQALPNFGKGPPKVTAYDNVKCVVVAAP